MLRKEEVLKIMQISRTEKSEEDNSGRKNIYQRRN